MKVLLVNTGVFPVPSPLGGTETHVYHLANSLARLGCEVHLVSDVGQAPFHENVTIHPINLPQRLFQHFGFWGYALRHLTGGILAFRSSFRLRSKFDLIHAHGRWAPFLLAFLKKVPLVYTLHDSPPSKELTKSLAHKIVYNGSYKILNETTAKRADHIIAVGSDIKEYLTGKGVPAERVSIIPSGVDVNVFQPMDQKRGCSCLFVGSLIERKGVRNLLQAIAGMPEEIKLTIVGDGPERKSLEEFVERLGVSHRVVFTGVMAPDQLAPLYAASSFFVLPSLSEGLPIVILEAMSCGCPVVATRVSGIADVVVDGHNGLLAEPGNVEDLKEKMMTMLENHLLRDSMGKNARETIERSYAWESVAERVHNVYDLVLSQAE